MRNKSSHNVPKLRFPEFKDKNWHNKPCCQLYHFKSTNTFSRDNLNYKNGAVKNIHYGDIHTKFSTLFDITKETVPYINSDFALSKIDKSNYCRDGDIVFADASEDLKDVGKSIEIINLNNEKHFLDCIQYWHAKQMRQLKLGLVAIYLSRIEFVAKFKEWHKAQKY